MGAEELHWRGHRAILGFRRRRGGGRRREGEGVGWRGIVLGFLVLLEKCEEEGGRRVRSVRGEATSSLRRKINSFL